MERVVKIIVCIKRVPDTECRIRVAGKGIDPAGIKYIISPYDEFALETALRLKEAKGAGDVVVISVGDSTAQEQLRSALAMGADSAVLLKGEVTLDGLATARALAAEIRDAGADLVLLGMKAADDDQQQVGPMLAELLDLPCVTVAGSVELYQTAGWHAQRSGLKWLAGEVHHDMLLLALGRKAFARAEAYVGRALNQSKAAVTTGAGATDSIWVQVSYPVGSMTGFLTGMVPSDVVVRAEMRR